MQIILTVFRPHMANWNVEFDIVIAENREELRTLLFIIHFEIKKSTGKSVLGFSRWIDRTTTMLSVTLPKHHSTTPYQNSEGQDNAFT